MALSDLLPTVLQLGATVLNAGSQVAKGNAAKTVGNRRQALAEFEASQLEQSATESRGVGMRGQQSQQHQTALVASQALARAAASGAGASDPTVLSIIARTAGEGSYRAALQLYEGSAQARLDTLRAAGLRYQGDTSAADASVAAGQANMGALMAAITGGSKALDVYTRTVPSSPKTALSDGEQTMYQKYWSGPATDAGIQLPEDMG